MAVTVRSVLTVGLVVIAALLPSNVAAQTETPEYYGLDTTGSVRVVFDGSGAVLTRVDYGPFGEELAAAPGAPNEKYAGLFRDEETGLDYAQARQYSPRTGRFTSVDPVYAGLFEPQRWNRYAYALNSPLTFVDPDGLDPCPPGSHYCEVVDVKAPAPPSVFSIATAIGLAMGMSGSSTPGNNTSPWQLGIQWVTGRGPQDQVFTEGDPLTDGIKESSHVDDLRDQVEESCRPGSGRFDNRLSGLNGVPKYLGDYSTLVTFGQTGNLASTFLGSYSLQYDVRPVSSNQMQLSVNITNTSSLGSALRPPVIGYTSWWRTNIADPISAAMQGGPMGPTTQHISWTETVTCRR